LTTADFTDERKAGLAAEILKFVEDKADERYYDTVELAGGYDGIDEDSQRLSKSVKSLQINHCVKLQPG